jgi:hypothetical protein
MDVLAAQLIAGGVDLLSRKDIGQLHYLWVFVGIN